MKKALHLKRVLRTALLVLLLNVVGMAKGYAQDFNVDGLNYTVNDDGVSVTLTGRADGMWSDELDIPEDVVYAGSHYSVTKIGDYAFADERGGLWGTLVIPNSVTTIGDHAFYYGGVLFSLILGNSVQVIGDYAFAGYSNLSGDLVIPSSVTSIGDGAFGGCGGFDNITVESGNSYYDSRDNCNAIIETSTNKLVAGCKNSFIPNTVTAIGVSALGGCGLSSFAIPPSVTSIGDHALAFNGLNSIVIPNNVVYIGKGAFEEESIESIVVEDGNPVYDSRDNCNAIIETSTNTLVIGSNNTVIPNSVTAVEDYAFFYRYFLTGDLVIPNSVKTIGAYAFYQCFGNEDYGSGDSVSLTIGNSVETIGELAFSGCRMITGDLVLPNSVTTIGEGAFSYCGFTGDLVVPKSITTIGNGTFQRCSFTGDLVIPNSVTMIGDWAFSGCSFNHIIVESGNARYDSRDNCNAIIEKGTNTLIRGCANTVIPNSVTTIGDYSFDYCSGFTGNLVIPNSVKTIGYGSFDGCSGTNVSLTIGNSVTTIGPWAFSWFEGLDAITCLAETPPVLIIDEYYWEDWWYEVPCTTLTVPCGYVSAYEASDWHDHFTTIQEDCASYAISVENTAGGTVSTSVNSAMLGEEIQISYTAEPGYGLNSITVCKANDPAMTVPCYGNSFIMPNYDVVVKPSFANTSVNENSNDAVSVYPSPTSGHITIEAENLRHVSIFNTLGQQVYDSSTDGDVFEYDFGSNEVGVYLIRVETATGIATKRVVLTE